MSLSHDIKLELSALHENQECCQIALLSALIHAAGSLVRSSGGLKIEISTGVDVNDLLSHCLLSVYGTGVSQAIESNSLGTRFVYSISQSVESVLTDCGLMRYDEGALVLKLGFDESIAENDCCKAAFVRGAFLGAGSLSEKSGYHLEFVLANAEFAEGLQGMIEEFDIKSGLSERRGRFIVYIKGADTIRDILTLMGARENVEQFDSLVTERGLAGAASRESNCYQANLDKSFKAAAEQLAAIEKLVKSGEINKLSEPLRQTALFRREHVDMSYDAMAKELGVSKSTLSNRLRRIVGRG